MDKKEILDELISVTKELSELCGRHTGRTTRLADDYIQKLFSKPNEWLEIIDHYDSPQSNQVLVNIILRRISLEHPTVKFDVEKGRHPKIKLNLPDNTDIEQRMEYLIQRQKELINLKNGLNIIKEDKGAL